jgi:integrase
MLPNQHGRIIGTHNAEARDLVVRNVATLVETPKGQSGRPSNSLSLEQASALLATAEGTRMHASVPIEEIARLAGHANTRTTEVVYRRELRPVLTAGAEAMDRLFHSSSVPAGSGPRA